MASEKKMCQIRDAYEANKGKEGVTISKICKQSGVPIAEYVDWLTLQAKPKLVPVEIVEHEQTPAPARTEISNAKLDLPIIFVANIKFRKYGERKENVPNT